MSYLANEEDRMLIVRAKTGDTDAYDSLVRKYRRRVYYLCHRMTGTHQSADDLSQETFIKAFFSLSKFKEEMNFFSWIRKIAVNSSLNYLKVRKREKPVENLDNLNHKAHNPHTTHAEMPQERLERTQMTKKFRKALYALPSDQKAIFVLKVYEDQSYQEISRMLKIPIGTVMSRLSRARQKLRAEMADYLQGGQ